MRPRISSCRRIVAVILFCAIVCLVTPGSSRGQDCLEYGDYLHLVTSIEFGGSVSDVAVAGHLAYVTTRDGRLQVLDVSTPPLPVVIGDVTTAAPPRNVAVAGSRAVVGSRVAAQGLPLSIYEIVGVADPQQPVVLGSVTLGHGVEDLEMVGDHVYVAAGGAGLVVLDVSDPTVPVELAQVALPDTSLGVTMSGDLVLVAAESAGLQVLDVSNPSAPTLLGAVDLPGEAMEVVAAGSYAYVASNAGGLLVVDLADPGNPVLVGSAPGAFQDVVLSGTIAFGKTYGGLRSFDITDPTTPIPLGAIHIGGHSYAAAVAGDHVLVAAGRLTVVDASNPAGAPPLAVMAEPVIAQRVVTDGHVAYVADEGHWFDEGGGLRIYDLGDPAAPLQRAFLPLEGCNRLAYEAGVVYTAADTGLVIVDVADPDAPIILGVWEHEYWNLWDLFVRDGIVTIAALTWGLVTVDATDPTAPVQTDHIDESGYTARLAWDGEHLFVNRLLDGFWVLSLADPLHPQIVADFPRASDEFPYYHGGMDVQDGLLWVGDGGSGVFAIDVTDIHATKVVAQIDTPSFAYDVVLAGSVAYVANREGGVQVVDISVPFAPWLVGNLAVAGSARDVTVTADGHVLATAGLEGVVVAWPQCSGGVPILLEQFTAVRISNGVDLAWRAGGDAEAGAFRLEGTRGSEVWPVPHRPLGSGRFAATDRSAQAAAPGAIDYRLFVNTHASGWRLLGEQILEEMSTPRALILDVQPNPFNPRAKVRFTIGREQRVDVAVHDVAGRCVRRLHNDVLPAGNHALTWNGLDESGRELPSGIYLVRLHTDDGLIVKKVTLVR